MKPRKRLYSEADNSCFKHNEMQAFKHCTVDCVEIKKFDFSYVQVYSKQTKFLADYTDKTTTWNFSCRHSTAHLFCGLLITWLRSRVTDYQLMFSSKRERKLFCFYFRENGVFWNLWTHTRFNEYLIDVLQSLKKRNCAEIVV